MKKFLSVLLAAVMFASVLALASCGGAANSLDVSVEAVKKMLPEKIDLSDMDLLTNADSGAENLLVFNYGLKEDLIPELDSYFLTVSHRSTDARAVVVIKFKESDKTAEAIESAKTSINDYFVKTLVNTTGRYDPEESKIASAASFRVYGNALSFASYDTEGNNTVFDAVEAAK